MFPPSTYKTHRELLKKLCGTGILLFPGNSEESYNYPANCYPFRQDSNFLYFFGISQPGLAGLLDTDQNQDILFREDSDPEDMIWTGPVAGASVLQEMSGTDQCLPFQEICSYLQRALRDGRKVHFLPPYRPSTQHQLLNWLGIPPAQQKEQSSEALSRGVIHLRSIKSEEEIQEIEKASEVSTRMHRTVMKMACPGITEQAIAGMLEGIALSAGCRVSFPPIVSMRGEILHNHDHSGILEEGKLLLTDAGCETAMGYAADITRTVPVGGVFSMKQKDIYSIVQAMSKKTIPLATPETPYRTVHWEACKIMVEGLCLLGLMKGNPEEAVEAGAHALFMPHGIGHMMGLDVHDMEGLGEDLVGYDEEIPRNKLFGHASLRMGRRLKPGMVVTHEPGIYFIPGLIEQWKTLKKHAEYIHYERIEDYMDFGGIRIEDNLLITPDGNRILGPPLPKTIKSIEKAMKHS